MNHDKGIFLGGVSLSFGYSVFQPEILQTVICAIIGSLVSYLISQIIKRWEKYRNKKK